MYYDARSPSTVLPCALVQFCYTDGMKPRDHIGLVLSGGGTRGIAHIGAWRVLERMGFSPAAIAGCSMGAIVGAMIASGKTAEDMESFVLSQRLFSFFRFPVSTLGITNFSQLEQRLMRFLRVRRFEQLRIPLTVNATDLTTGSSVVYRSGRLWPALRASMSVPGLFAPVRRNRHVLVDGGVIDQQPFSLLPKDVSRFVLINSSPPKMISAERYSILDLLKTSLNVMQNESARLRLERIPKSRYVLIEPNLEGRFLIETERGYAHLLALGEQAAKKQKPALRRLFTSGSRPASPTAYSGR